jgi:hypothetical protein
MHKALRSLLTYQCSFKSKVIWQSVVSITQLSTKMAAKSVTLIISDHQSVVGQFSNKICELFASDCIIRVVRSPVSYSRMSPLNKHPLLASSMMRGFHQQCLEYSRLWQHSHFLVSHRCMALQLVALM